MQKRLGLMHGIGEMIREIVLADRDRMELGAGQRRHLARLHFFVVFGPIEGEREGADRIGMMPGGEAEDRAGVESAAQIAADRHVRAQAHAHSFLEHLGETRRGSPASERRMTHRCRPPGS